MDRLQKKCFIVSAGIHLLLALILVVGPAFISPDVKPVEVEPLTFVPDILVDANVTGGGNRNAKPPAGTPNPALVTPTKPPPPVSETPRSIPHEEQQPDKQIADSGTVEPSPARKSHKPVISTTLVPHKPSPHSKARTSSADEDVAAEEQQIAATRRRWAGAIAKAAEGIREGTGSATSIVSSGPGTDGPSYASYAAWVKTVFEDAWIPPQDVSANSAITLVKITIRRDGTVALKRIIRPSGDSQVDASVQRALDRVPTIGRPFPEGAKEEERTYTLRFDLKAKLGLS